MLNNKQGTPIFFLNLEFWQTQGNYAVEEKIMEDNENISQ